MPTPVTVLRAFVASPGDVREEREVLEHAIRELNETWSKTLGVRLELLKWETHALPGIGTDAQEVVGEAIGDDYDIFICIMWARFGTPTGRAGSGTAEEFQDAYLRYRDNPDSIRLMVYFKDKSMPPSEIDPEQLTSVMRFRSEISDLGVFFMTFENPDEFGTLVRIHLGKQVQAWGKTWGPKPQTEPQVQEAEAVEAEQDRTARAADREDEEGLLDLEEIVEESFTSAAENLSKITTATGALGEKLKRRTLEIEKITNVPGGVSIRAAKRVSRRSAGDFDEFVKELDVQVPAWARSQEEGVDAIERMAALAPDFLPSGRGKFATTLELTCSLRESTETSLKSVKEFRDSVAGVPRLTKELTRSKRDTLRVLDNLIGELRATIRLMIEAEIALKQVLADND